MRDDSDFPRANCLRVSFFQQNVDHFYILPTSIKIYYLKLLLSFVIFLDFAIRTQYVEDLFHKKGFTSISLLPFAKKLGRSSYDVTMTYYDVILILLLLRFVANAEDLKWDNFLLLTMNRRGVIRIYLLLAKMTPLPQPQAYTDLK